MNHGDVIYVAGGFTSNRANPSVNWNIAIAQQVCFRLIGNGFTVFSPHMNFGWLAMESIEHQPNWEEMLDHCLKILERCDHLVLCPLYEFSKGALLERDRAEELGIPITHFHWNEIFKENTEPVS